MGGNLSFHHCESWGINSDGQATHQGPLSAELQNKLSMQIIRSLFILELSLFKSFTIHLSVFGLKISNVIFYPPASLSLGHSSWVAFPEGHQLFIPGTYSVFLPSLMLHLSTDPLALCFKVTYWVPPLTPNQNRFLFINYSLITHHSVCKDIHSIFKIFHIIFLLIYCLPTASMSSIGTGTMSRWLLNDILAVSGRLDTWQCVE